MLNIVKGKETMTIPTSTFKSIFEPAGWVIENTGVTVEVAPKVPSTDKGLSEDDNPDADNEDGEEDEEDTGSEDSSEEDEEESDELTDEELEETPLGELNFEELKRLVDIKELDRTGLKSKKELRALIKANM